MVSTNTNSAVTNSILRTLLNILMELRMEKEGKVDFVYGIILVQILAAISLGKNSRVHVLYVGSLQ